MYVRRPPYSGLKSLLCEVDNKSGFQCAVSYGSRIMKLCVSIDPFLYVPFKTIIDIARETFQFLSAPPPPLKMSGIQTLKFLSGPFEKWNPKGIYLSAPLKKKSEPLECGRKMERSRMVNQRCSPSTTTTTTTTIIIYLTTLSCKSTSARSK